MHIHFVFETELHQSNLDECSELDMMEFANTFDFITFPQSFIFKIKTYPNELIWK